MQLKYMAYFLGGALLTLTAGTAATASPLAGLHFLLGSWSCTYRAGAVHFAYGATYAYENGGHTLRQTDSWGGGSAEELLAYDARRGGWTGVVLDDQGTATILRATGSDPNHIAYRSVYPDASIATRFDRASATEYTLHGEMRSGGKTISSVDTCLRTAH